MSLPKNLLIDDAARERMHSDYIHLHTHPELSMQEYRTVEWIEKQLDDIGVEHFRCGTTGVVGIMRNGAGPTIAYRADTDGLPIEEDSGKDYASTVRGTLADGSEVPVMHGCGHDTHVITALTAARILAEQTDAWSGTIVWVFQPAEETAEGARAMLEDGLWDKAPRPEVVLGQHVMPLQNTKVMVIAGPAMAMANSLKITFHGKQAHGSQPENSIDPVTMASYAVTRLQTIVSREVSPSDRAVVTVGTFKAGFKDNIIPQSAEIQLNVRTFHPDTRAKVLDAIARIVKAEALASGAPEPEIEPITQFPQCVNHPQETEKVRAALVEELGAANVVEGAPMMGSEDVGALADAIDVPLVYWFFGAYDSPDESTYATNHNPGFAPDMEASLDTGYRAALSAVLAYTGK